ncbi:MAG: hypothetical protein HY288_16330 [Planctomycetia bacterium]|nr:hypothetical protein [Planctomycetia bacterium]
MGPFWIVLAAVLTAGPTSDSRTERADSDPANSNQSAKSAAPLDGQDYTAAQLRIAVHDALRREAISRGAARESALRKLLALYTRLEQDTQLSDGERLQLRTVLRNRLARSSRALQSQLANGAASARSAPDATSKAAKLPKGDQGILAQRPQVPGAPATAPSAQKNGQELVDLIQKTIAPGTWDVNGGLGVIRYFENKQVLVIRQSDEVHGQLEGLIRGLRGDP